MFFDFLRNLHPPPSLRRARRVTAPPPPFPPQALEEERDGLSHILGRERSHGSGLEQLIEASRLREASVAAEQRQLAREKDRLEAKVTAFLASNCSCCVFKLVTPTLISRRCICCCDLISYFFGGESITIPSGLVRKDRTATLPLPGFLKTGTDIVLNSVLVDAVGLTPAEALHFFGRPAEPKRLNNTPRPAVTTASSYPAFSTPAPHPPNRYAQAAKLSEELSQARDCLADLSSRLSVSRPDASMNDPGTPSTPASSDVLLETSNAAVASSAAGDRKAAAPASEWTRQRGAGAGPAAVGDRNGASRLNGRGVVSGSGLGSGNIRLGRSYSPLMGSSREGATALQFSTSTPFLPAESPSRAVPVETTHGGSTAELGGGAGESRGPTHGQDDDSGVFDLEDVRGFVRRESQRLRESVRARWEVGGGSG